LAQIFSVAFEGALKRIANTQLGQKNVRPHRTVAVFDLDGTLTRYDTYLRYLIGFCRRHPSRILRSWRLPLDVAVFKAQLRDNTWLKRQFLRSILGGMTEADLRSWTQCFVDRLMTKGLRPRATELLRNHQRLGDRTVLLSASPDIFVKEIAMRLNFSECLCTIAERDARGRLTGNLDGGNCYGLEKLKRMQALLGADRSDMRVIAYADHSSDLPLLRWADEAVLVNPSLALTRVAAKISLKVARW